MDSLPVFAQELQVKAVALHDMDELQLDLAQSGEAQPGLYVLLFAAVRDVGRFQLPRLERAQPEGGLVERYRAVEVFHKHPDLADVGQLKLLFDLVSRLLLSKKRNIINNYL